MNIPSSKQWPADYLTWSGSFSELVKTASEVLALLEPHAKPPTERLLRYYQQQGVLGRGERQGNRSLFGFDDLERVVATKGLVQQNWTLDNASKLFSASVGSEPVSALLYSPSPAPAAEASSVFLAQQACAPSSAVQEDATSVVARLMASSHAAQPNHVRSKSVSPLVAPLPVSTALGGSIKTSAVKSYQPTPWLTVYLDEAAVQGAAPQERALACQTLEALLKHLR